MWQCKCASHRVFVRSAAKMRHKSGSVNAEAQMDSVNLAKSWDRLNLARRRECDNIRCIFLLHKCVGKNECCSVNGTSWEGQGAVCASHQCPSLSMKLLDFPLMRLWFTHLSSLLLVVVLIEALFLILLGDLLGFHSVWLHSESLQMIKIWQGCCKLNVS